MTDFQKGDLVLVDDLGDRLNASGSGEIVGFEEDWPIVSPIRSTGWHGWKRPISFRPDRLTKLPPLSAPAPAVAGAMLGFESGATRNRKENELQYEGFISPLALQMFAEYMHENRFTADGSVRASDNWQKGIPDESYRDSLLRHVMDLWLIYRDWGSKAREGGDKRKALAGAFFNLQGLMHNLALLDLEDEGGEA